MAAEITHLRRAEPFVPTHFQDSGTSHLLAELNTWRERRPAFGGCSREYRQPFLPVGRNQACVLRNCVDVITQSQGHDVSLQTINDVAALFAGSAVRLLDGDGLACLRLPVLDEGLVEILAHVPPSDRTRHLAMLPSQTAPDSELTRRGTGRRNCSLHQLRLNQLKHERHERLSCGLLPATARTRLVHSMGQNTNPAIWVSSRRIRSHSQLG